MNRALSKHFIISVYLYSEATLSFCKIAFFPLNFVNAITIKTKVQQTENICIKATHLHNFYSLSMVKKIGKIQMHEIFANF